MECDACGAGGAKQVCPCHTVRYCNKECQIKVYKEHKKKCTDWLLKEVKKREEKCNLLVRQHNACLEELILKRGTDATWTESGYQLFITNAT